jgi:hypothetical protein
MKLVIGEGLRLILDAIPDVFDLTSRSEIKTHRPRSASAQELSRRAWKTTQVQFRQSINGFGEARRAAAGTDRR